MTLGRDDAWVITGDLTIKDVTTPVTVEFEQTGSVVDPYDTLRVGFEGSVVANRKAWPWTGTPPGDRWRARLRRGLLPVPVAALGDDAAPPQVRGGGERPAVRPGRRR